MTDIAKIRNLAIVAHIDHGKTTLIDSVFRATQTFRKNQEVTERLMDNNVLERERGITIRSKHCTVSWNDYLINIIDTPGHADFSGEVERVLSMVDSVLLLVDAIEGPMPQTRYVLMRALKLGLRPIVVINKIDRPNARPDDALNKTFDLFIELGATDEQSHFPVIYGSGLDGWFVNDLDKEAHIGMDPLFQTIIDEVPPPQVNQDGAFLMQVSSLDWSDYIGQIGCGRVLRGTLKKGEDFTRIATKLIDPLSQDKGWELASSSKVKGTHLWITRGLTRVETDEISAGDIVWLAGPQRSLKTSRDRRTYSLDVFPGQQRTILRTGWQGDYAPSVKGTTRKRTSSECRASNGRYRSPGRCKSFRTRRTSFSYLNRRDATRRP